jgi:branched-chain amino acid transport system substrate-binding protein
LIISSVEAVNGNLDDKAGLRKALEAANFESTRGKLTYGKNHMPLDNYYALEVVADADGKWGMGSPKLALEHGADPYVAECEMPPAE